MLLSELVLFGFEMVKLSVLVAFNAIVFGLKPMVTFGGAVAGVKIPQTSFVSEAPLPTTELHAVFTPASVAESPTNVGIEPE
jgi:hypothetical protein